MKIIKKFKQFYTWLWKNWYISNINFRDINSLFVYDEQDKKWYGTSPLLLIDVRHYITTTKKTNAEFDLDDNSPDGERARTKWFWTSSPKLLLTG